MKKLLLALFAFASISAFAQNKQDYFQQTVDYSIYVTLNDVNHSLDGNISMVYTNNSPDTLREIYMHLWPNAYKDRQSAMACQHLVNRDIKFHYANEEERGYIDKIDFKINGQTTQWKFDSEHKDIALIPLEVPLLPGATTNISTPFFVKIPSGEFSRLGHIGQSYQITQWYPKPAVYDRAGWHPMPYLTQGEFYSEFGNFEVQITAPKNYLIAATGDLQTPSEIAFLKDAAVKGEQLKHKFAQWDKSVQDVFLKKNEFPESSKETKTLHFSQSNVHDFAWFADKRFHVLKTPIKLFNGKKITGWAFFTNGNANLWFDAPKYLERATQFYSERVGVYPYNVVTAVDGTISAGGGMEYPTITVIGRSTNAKELDRVITHEVGHNWFYGILGSNERANPWMDEGFNSFFENAYIDKYYPKEKMLGALADKKIAKWFDVNQYMSDAAMEYGILSVMRMGLDQPLGLASDSLTSINYGLMVYAKTAWMLRYLEAYIGKRNFAIAMHNYYKDWAFKHPQPQDIKTVFEQVSRQNLDWFFDDVVATNKTVNYAITEIMACDTRVAVKVKNKGMVQSPFSLTGIKDGKPSATIWYNGFEKNQVVEYLVEDFDEIVLDYEHVMPELDRKNNQMKVNKFLPGIEPLRLQLFGSLENPKKTQIFFSPILKWNNYNKLILGTQLYNTALPFKNFEYSISPEISTYNATPAGTGFLRYRWYWYNGFIEKVQFGLYGKSYDYNKDLRFKRMSSGINIDFRKASAVSPHNHKFKFRHVLVNKELPSGANSLAQAESNYQVFSFKYLYESHHILHPVTANLGMESFDGNQKWSVEGSIGKRTRRGKIIELRTYAGILKNTTQPGSFFNFTLDGRNDYMFDYYYFGRSETTGLLSNQFFAQEGGFRGENIQTADKAIWALNFSIPVWRSFGFYIDNAIMQYTNPVSSGFATESFNGIGMQWVPIKDFFELYLGFNDKELLTFRYVVNIDLEEMIGALTKGRF